MTLHWQAAPHAMAGLLRTLSSTLGTTDFYLAGGTALALLEGHRISVDLDFFSSSFDQPDELLPPTNSTGTSTLWRSRTSS